MNTYYPELHNPANFPCKEPYIDVRFHYDADSPDYSFYEVVTTSGPVYFGDKARFYSDSTTFGTAQDAIAHAQTLERPIFYSVH